ncbi:MAG TPA: hypothetical protein LFV91_05540 [Rickettsia endosymbiont of Bembidion nr. Transversale]|nr:hypothetical protein [Rickettsia endosymbiont of Bembidion nr. Transversale]
MSKGKKTAEELFKEFQKTYTPEANKAFVKQREQDSKNLEKMVNYHTTTPHHGDLHQEQDNMHQEQDNSVKKLGGTKHHSKCEII